MDVTHVQHFPSRHSARPPSSLWAYSTTPSRHGSVTQGPGGGDRGHWTGGKDIRKARELGRAYGNLAGNGHQGNPYTGGYSTLRGITESPELCSRASSTPSRRRTFPNLDSKTPTGNHRRPYSQSVSNNKIMGQHEAGRRTPSWFKRSQTDVLLQMDERLLQPGSHVTTPQDDVMSNASLDDLTSFEDLQMKTSKNATLRSLLMPSELESYLDHRSRSKGRNGTFSKSIYVEKSSSKSGPINRPHTTRPSLQERRKHERQTMKRAHVQPTSDENVFNQQNRTYELHDRVKTILRDGVLRKVDP